MSFVQLLAMMKSNVLHFKTKISEMSNLLESDELVKKDILWP